MHRDVLSPQARSTDPPSSHEAAAKARSFAPDHRTQILGVLWHPLCAAAIAKFTGLSIVQVCRRMPELQLAGKVRRTGREIRVGGRLYEEWEQVYDDRPRFELSP